MSYRIRDILFASLTLTVLSPVFLILILLLWLTQGKVFFTQLRPGLDARPFRLLKFRTLYEINPDSDPAAELNRKTTPMGAFLRKTALDELPQLVNVLKGEMSLVGPRPLLMEYLDLYSETEKKRHAVRPGITGWAQVNGRNCITFKQKFAHDLWYVANRSHALDLRILVRTLLVVVKGEGDNSGGLNPFERYDGTN
jgi:lipopolysaccharide/colanic/teichoic acid biosynthesis glycosyltransferase